MVLSRWSCGILHKQKKVIIGKLKPITFLSTSWIPRSKIIWSNWESASRFRCLLASWIPRFDFFKAIWEVRYCKGFKIHAQHSLWFLKRHRNYSSVNCFSLHCKYLVKQFPACCFILENGNSWMKKQLISRKKSKSRSFFSQSGNSWFPRSRTIPYLLYFLFLPATVVAKKKLRAKALSFYWCG